MALGEVNQKLEIMKSTTNTVKSSTIKGKQRKEYAPDRISKSMICSLPESSLLSFTMLASRQFLISNPLNFSIMNKFRNQVQLIGNIGETPKVTSLDSGKKVARFSLATNEFYRDSSGTKVQNTQWHQIVAWGKTAEIIEKYASKGSEVGIQGKLKRHSFTGQDGNPRYVTEVHADEVLLFGSAPVNAKAKKSRA